MLGYCCLPLTQFFFCHRVSHRCVAPPHGHLPVVRSRLSSWTARESVRWRLRDAAGRCARSAFDPALFVRAVDITSASYGRGRFGPDTVERGWRGYPSSIPGTIKSSVCHRCICTIHLRLTSAQSGITKPDRGDPVRASAPFLWCCASTLSIV